MAAQLLVPMHASRFRAPLLTRIYVVARKLWRLYYQFMKIRQIDFKFCVLLLFVSFLGSGCQPARQPDVQPSGQNSTSNVQKSIQYNLDKLKDRSYTKTYGDGYTWYTAAEELGEIGAPAVPHLIEKLKSKDPYELKLALYALLLATQDSKVTKLTNGEYVNLKVALSESHNAENRQIALKWWEKHKNKFKTAAKS